MVKTYPNTKKSRNLIPKKPGAYNLKDKSGKVVYTGMTKDLNRRVKEHHYDKSKHFASVSITPTRSKSKAKTIEKRRLKSNKPSENK
ncbi:MAG: GIY-YIG nuclease family protein [Promethearchaeota archaeon]